jgi:hypothetical protein
MRTKELTFVMMQKHDVGVIFVRGFMMCYHAFPSPITSDSVLLD